MAELQVAVLGEGLAEGGPWAADRWVPGLRLAVIVTANRSGPLGSGASTGMVVVNAAVSTAYWPTPRQPPRPGLETSGQAVPGPADGAGGCHPRLLAEPASPATP